MPYVLLLTFRGEPAAIVATQRFSNLGIFAVGIVLVTGAHQYMELSRQRRGALWHGLRAPADGEGGVIF